MERQSDVSIARSFGVCVWMSGGGGISKTCSLSRSFWSHWPVPSANGNWSKKTAGYICQVVLLSCQKIQTLLIYNKNLYLNNGWLPTSDNAWSLLPALGKTQLRLWLQHELQVESWLLAEMHMLTLIYICIVKLTLHQNIKLEHHIQDLCLWEWPVQVTGLCLFFPSHHALLMWNIFLSVFQHDNLIS